MKNENQKVTKIAILPVEMISEPWILVNLENNSKRRIKKKRKRLKDQNLIAMTDMRTILIEINAKIDF